MKPIICVNELHVPIHKRLVCGWLLELKLVDTVLLPLDAGVLFADPEAEADAGCETAKVLRCPTQHVQHA
nr:hypothetical protein BaRGS_001411 [Batillaria attramentaria]